MSSIFIVEAMIADSMATTTTAMMSHSFHDCRLSLSQGGDPAGGIIPDLLYYRKDLARAGFFL